MAGLIPTQDYTQQTEIKENHLLDFYKDQKIVPEVIEEIFPLCYDIHMVLYNYLYDMYNLKPLLMYNRQHFIICYSGTTGGVAGA